MKQRNALFALALGATLSSTPAIAERGFFVNFAAGQASVDVPSSRFYPGVSNVQKDETDTSFRIGGGYYVHKNIALEAGYNNFGEHSLRASGTDSTSFETEAFTAGLRARLPLFENFDVTGKLGAVAWQYDSVQKTATTTSKGDDNGTDAYYGLGLTTYLSRHWTVELGAERHQIGDDDLDHGSLGITYTFAR